MASWPIFSRPFGTGRPFQSNPGLASWAKFSRPYGTEYGLEFLHGLFRYSGVEGLESGLA
jgi:hypothetical protein